MKTLSTLALCLVALVDHVLLVLTPDGWKIIHLSDTRTTEGCAAP